VANVKFGLRLLETLTSALYDNPIVLFREYVQNSVDAYKVALKNKLDPVDNFSVNIDVDEDNRSITIFDNGYGIEAKYFDATMLDIGVDKKSGLSDQIGFRGIGRLSAIPFCEKLIFRNKPQGSKNIFVFTWDGKAFNEMLIKDSTAELSKAFDVITASSLEKYDGNVGDHFFSVFVEKYNIEIQELIHQKDFKKQLASLLPLKYLPCFKYQTEIKNSYFKWMHEQFDKYCFDIKLNSEPLYKQYTDENILESGICYWELKFPTPSNEPEEPFGLLWFTFNRKISANPLDQPYGIFVRSKNMQMGNNNSLVDAIFRSKPDDYIPSYRELTQTIQGVYGEMLIDSSRFNDNARRDWFKLEGSSIILRDIIFEFLKRLYDYRKTASKAFSEKKDENTTKNKEKLRETLVGLAYAPDTKTFIDKFYKDKKKADKDKENKNYQKRKNDEKNKLDYADEDVPFFDFSLQKLYNKMLLLMRDFFSEDGNLETFLRIRAFIKKGLNKEE
jgi:molecular chaperone HtpG